MYQRLLPDIVVKTVLCLSIIALPISLHAEELNVTITMSEYDLLANSPVFDQIEKGFEATPHTLTWVQLGAEEIGNIPIDSEYDGTFGNIPLGSPTLENIVQVPVPLIRQALLPIVLEQTACPGSLDELREMQVAGIEHYDAFTTAERRLKREIPRYASLADVMQALKTGEAEASISFDYLIPRLKELFDIDLKLCKDVRIKSFVYYLYLHNRHSDKVDSITSALEAEF